MRLAGLAGLLCVACASQAPVGQSPDLPAGLLEVWSDVICLPPQHALVSAEQFGFEATGSVAGERARQRLLSRIGRINQAFDDIGRWQQEGFGNPADLVYLHTRLLDSSERQAWVFLDALGRWPGHPWLSAGYCQASLNTDSPNLLQLESVLAGANPSIDSGPMLRRARARVLARRGFPEKALELLYADGFDLPCPESLGAGIRIADNAGLSKLVRLWEAEFAMQRNSQSVSVKRRCLLVAERCISQISANGRTSLNQICDLLDFQSQRLGLPVGWAEAERYLLGPLGALVKPDLTPLIANGQTDGPIMLWQEQGLLPILGERLDTGGEMLLLTGVRLAQTDWPGLDEPLRLVVARKGYSSQANEYAGGTVFRGFYLREDRAFGLVEPAKSRMEDFSPVSIVPGYLHQPTRDSLLPESEGLAWRLVYRCLQESDSSVDELLRTLSWQQLVLHESCHLPDVLPLVGGEEGVGGIVGPALKAFLKFGDGVAFLEFQCQARALALSPNPHWTLAETVLSAEGGPPTYKVAYQHLLAGLVQLGREMELSPFARWDQLEQQQLRDLGRRFCQLQGIELPPEGAVEAILDSLIQVIDLDTKPEDD